MKRLAMVTIALFVMIQVQFLIPSHNTTERGDNVIIVGNKQIQLPADVYVEAIVGTGLCIERHPCPETPLYVLRYENSNDKISVGVRTGEVSLAMQTFEENERVMKRFNWLFDALPWQKFRRMFNTIE